MRLIFHDEPSDGAIRVDLAWELFFANKSKMPEGYGGRLILFTQWLWDELGRRAGLLNKNSKGEAILTIPALTDTALDFVLRIGSFWADEIYVKKGDGLSENLWKKPVLNVFDDKVLDASNSSIVRGSADYSRRFLMPLLGPGRAFFRIEQLQNGESAARYHSHSAVDEYYLILAGSGTLRYNHKEIPVKHGDLISKPTGPDAVSQLIADSGEPLRILDMEIWHDRPDNSKDLIINPDFNEIFMRGPGWSALIPAEALMKADDFYQHYDEGYRRNRDGDWAPSRNRGHKKVRERTGSDQPKTHVVLEKAR